MAKREVAAVDHQGRIALSLGQANGFEVVAELRTDSSEGKDPTARNDTPSTDIKPGTKIGDVAINSKDGAEMVWVPGGDFLMGSSDEEIAALLKDNPGWKREWFDKDKPQHKVYLDGYWVYKCEVTVAQYRNFCSETGRTMPEEPQWGRKDDHPIVKVTWKNAADYAEWAGASLPTEAQWEKAARGTDGRTYPWGNEWDAAKCSHRGWGTEPAGSNPAGASPYGCLNMAGNVWEWCADRYLGSYYAQSQVNDPRTRKRHHSRPARWKLELYQSGRLPHVHAGRRRSLGCA